MDYLKQEMEGKNILFKNIKIEQEKQVKTNQKNYLKTGNQDEGISKMIKKSYEKCENLIQEYISTANSGYFEIDDEIKKVNKGLKTINVEAESQKMNTISLRNFLIQQGLENITGYPNIMSNNIKGKKIQLINRKLASKPFQYDKRYKTKLKRKVGTRGKTTKIIKNEPPKEVNENNDLIDITYKEIDSKIGLKEQVYCFCNYISYGNMVKCDNPNCKIEWFHFHCVGLRNLPKGKWFCSEKCKNEYFSIKK